MTRKEKLHKEVMYYIWCVTYGKKPQLCSSMDEYKEFLEESKVHCGDCTLVAMTCSRCEMQGYEIMAQSILDCVLYKGDNGCP